MSDQPGLLREIVENPDDVGPRLVYADWLMERGDPRGEFIQWQCRAEDFPVDSDERRVLEAHAESLFARHRRKWTASLRTAGIRSYEFRRGFVEQATWNADRSPDELDGLFAEHPLRTLKIRKLTKRVAEVAACPQLARLHTLDLTGAVSESRAAILFASPHLTGLVALLASSNGFGRMGTEALVAGEWRSLEMLNLRSNRIDEAVCETLARGLPPTLRHLEIGLNPLSDAGIAAIARSERLSKLHHLDVNAPMFTAVGLSETVDPESVGIASAEALVTATFADSLRVLHMRGWRLGDEARALLRARLPNCEIDAMDTFDGFMLDS